MNFTEYQALAMGTKSNIPARTLDHNEHDLVTAALGMTGEAGEFADLVKKWWDHGHPFDRDKAIKEIGDVLWYASLAAFALGINLDVVAQVNLDKLAARYGGELTTEKSMNRAPEDV